MSNVPQEIITDILSRLPVKSLLRFKCVCKPWLSLISNPHFVKMHLHQATQNNHFNLMLYDLNAGFNQKFYSIDYQQTSYTQAVEIDLPAKAQTPWLRILGSCNGLLYICTFDYAIWNPSTKEYKKVPQQPPQDLGMCVHGFGYDSNSDEYKVVRIVPSRNTADEYNTSQVNVYTMGTKSWRKIKNTNYYMYGEPGMPVNDSLIWLAREDHMSVAPNSLISFHLVDEEFRKVSHPECVNDIVCAAVLNGQLCILNDVNNVQGDVWMMNNDGGKDSWIKLYTIPQPTRVHSSAYLRKISKYIYLNLLCFSMTGEVILSYDDCDLLLYDPKLDKVEFLPNLGIPRSFGATPYVGSLVSLKSYAEPKQTKRKR